MGTHNSGCSQMLEGLLEKMYGERFEAYSAGVVPERISIHVVKAMAEVGVDLSTHHAKSVDEFRDLRFDYIVCASSGVRDACRYLPDSGEYFYTDLEHELNQITEKSADTLGNIRKGRDKIQAWLADCFGKIDERLSE